MNLPPQPWSAKKNKTSWSIVDGNGRTILCTQPRNFGKKNPQPDHNQELVEFVLRMVRKGSTSP